MALTLAASELSGLTLPTYNSGAANKIYVDTVSGSITTYANGQFHPSASGDFPYISTSSLSSNSILTNSLTINANQISGIASPQYPSSVANKKYVDTQLSISGGGADTSSQVTIGTGLNFGGGDGNLYHDGVADTLTVKGYAKISSNSVSGQEALSWLNASGSEYDQAYKFSSNANNLFYPSTNGNTLNSSYSGHSGNTGKHYPSSQLKSNFYLSSMGYGHSSNTDIHFTKTSLDDDYYPSSVGAALSSNFQSHEADSTIHFTQGDITTVGTVTTGTIRGSALASGTQYYDAYQHSSNTGIHLTSAQKTDLTDSGVTELHKHNLSGSNDITSWDKSNWTNSGLKWDGDSWVAQAFGGGVGGGDTSGQVTLASGLSLKTGTNLYHDGSADTLYIGGDLNVNSVSSSAMSSATVTTNNFNINANTISGLIDPIYPSAAANKHYVDDVSGSITTWASSTFPTSSETHYGWCSVSNAGTFGHSGSSRPSWVSLSPSGANPIAFSFTMDDTDITVYHTSPDAEMFSWKVVV